MSFHKIVVFLSTVISAVCGTPDQSFPPGFKWGVATSSYQIEGAWNISDKSANIWDTYVHEVRGRILDGSDGDVACDSYHHWRRDIEMVKEMDLDFYRFSISWTRLLPNGFSNEISADGARYYGELIQGLLDNGIEPLVTIYHWDLPQKLQDLGGWANPLSSDWFADYARVVFSLYGDRVKTWITINEPLVICSIGHGMKLMPPALNDPLNAKYLCDKNVLMAHAKAYRVYEKEFKDKYKGRISLSNQLVWYEAATPEDEDITKLVRQFSSGMYGHPIYSAEGGWPADVERVVAENSKNQGYPRSRLPPFTDEEKNLVRGTFDFYAVNHYTSKTVHRSQEAVSHSFTSSKELNVLLEGKPEWTRADSFWFFVNPEGIRNTLRWIKENYGDVEILITENGYSDANKALEDDYRVQYYKDHLHQVLLAIKEDGVKVTGYAAWSLMDNFEWIEGYSRTFGLYQVNFTSPTRERTPRLSARYYAKVVRAHSLDVAAKDEL